MKTTREILTNPDTLTPPKTDQPRLVQAHRLARELVALGANFIRNARHADGTRDGWSHIAIIDRVHRLTMYDAHELSAAGALDLLALWTKHLNKDDHPCGPRRLEWHHQCEREFINATSRPCYRGSNAAFEVMKATTKEERAHAAAARDAFYADVYELASVVDYFAEHGLGCPDIVDALEMARDVIWSDRGLLYHPSGVQSIDVECRPDVYGDERRDVYNQHLSAVRWVEGLAAGWTSAPPAPHDWQ